jgi:hypothetical protein
MAEQVKPLAFIYADGKIETGSAHWRIIDKIWMGDIAEFLYKSQEDSDSMAWGWIWPTKDVSATGRAEVVVEFYTEIAPHHQSQVAFPAAIDAIQKQLGVDVIDIETPEASPGILQRFTPQGIQQSAPEPVDYDKRYAPQKFDEFKDTDTKGQLGIVTLKRDQVGDVIISTVDLRAFSRYGEDPYETMIFGGGMDGTMFPSQTSDTALHTHDNTVQLVKDFEAGKFNDPDRTEDVDHRFFSHTAASQTQECFGLFKNKLWFGDKHHQDIINRIMEEKGYDWEDFFTLPSLFGWYNKVTKAYTTSTDSSAPQNTELEPLLVKMLTAKFGEGVHKYIPQNWDDWPGTWVPDGTPRADDLDARQVPGLLEPEGPNSEQMKLFSKIDPESMHIMGNPGLSVIKVKPPEGAGHSNKEKPFLYYAPTHTVFETTDYCHHSHVIPMITEALQESTGYVDYGGDAWINGDITDPESSGQNWIKFIHGGPIPKSLVDYFTNKYPDRDVVYNTDEGWIPLTDDAINKTAATDYGPSGAFAYIDGHVIIAHIHHQGIIAALLNKGWTWEDLFEVPQAWGWWRNAPADGADYYDINYHPTEVWVRLTSDAGMQTASDEEVIKAVGDTLGLEGIPWPKQPTRGIENTENYGKGLSGKDNLQNYLDGGVAKEYAMKQIQTPVPDPPNRDQTTMPTNFPPPRQSATIRDMEGVMDRVEDYGFDGCFGYLEVSDTLYLGETHHAQIIAELINEGMDWETLMSSRQMWGWADSYFADNGWNNAPVNTMYLRFSTDEARQDKGIKPKVLAAFKQAFPDWKITMESGYGYKSQEGYGDRAKQQYLNEKPSTMSDEDWALYKERGY